MIKAFGAKDSGVTLNECEMYVKKSSGQTSISLPNGKVFSVSDLPDKKTRRWVASRKAKVVFAVEVGLISRTKACQMYSLSDEELSDWIKAVKSHGIGALKTTKLQDYRQF